MVIDEHTEIFDDIENIEVVLKTAKDTGIKSLKQTSNQSMTSSETFLTGMSELSSSMLSIHNDAKDITYFIKNALVIVFGIGDYDRNIMPSLIGVPQDYINCISTFLTMGYCVLYQNKNNIVEYIDRYDPKWKINSKTKIDMKKCKINAKTYWNYAEIVAFFSNVKDYIVKYQHDACIFLISCHGDTDGVILDSKGEELSLPFLFCGYDGKECQYLVDKPKIVFADACRGRLRDKQINTVKLKDENTNHNEHVPLDTSSGNVVDALVNEVKEHTLTLGNIMHDKQKKGDNNDKVKINNNWYHPKANFMFVYPNPEGYAAADGGIKGGYLIRSIKSVFSNLEISTKQSLNEIIRQIRSQTKIKAGKGTLECVEVVERMTYKVKFEKRSANVLSA